MHFHCFSRAVKFIPKKRVIKYTEKKTMQCIYTQIKKHAINAYSGKKKTCTEIHSFKKT